VAYKVEVPFFAVHRSKGERRVSDITSVTLPHFVIMASRRKSIFGNNLSFFSQPTLDPSEKDKPKVKEREMETTANTDSSSPPSISPSASSRASESTLDTPRSGTETGPVTPNTETGSFIGDTGHASEEVEKARKLSKRKSRLGMNMLSNLFPTLTNPNNADTPPQPHRKPLPTPYDLGDPATVNPNIRQSPPVQPADVDESDGKRKSSLFKKLQKVPSSIPHILHHSNMQSTTSIKVSAPEERLGRERVRSSSAERAPQKLQPNRLHVSHSPASRGRSSSAHPPRGRNVPTESPRVVSTPVTRPHSRNSSNGEHSPSPGPDKGKVRKSWLGGRSRSNSIEVGKDKGTGAWIMSPDSTAEYSTTALVNGQKVSSLRHVCVRFRLTKAKQIPELWNENGNVMIYLHPKSSGRGPSFKVPDHVFRDSRVLNEIFLSETIDAGTRNLSVDDAMSGYQQFRSSSPSGAESYHLHLPLGSADLDRLIAARNLFALLTNQPLVATKTNPSVFTTLCQVAGLLRQFGFTNYDGSSFGDSVDTAFGLFCDQFALADVRQSREKTLEALILGEQMRSWSLYNEAFSHAVGKYESLMELKSPLINNITVSTRKRLGRAHMDLQNRQTNLNHRLESFDFPSLFAGIASSTSTEEYRPVRFKEWRISFGKMRSFVLSYYKEQFGNWPPKARSKRNHFSQSGLNRQCLKMLYSDLCALYDLLVDRENLTPRAIDQPVEDAVKEEGENDKIDPSISALRKIMTEFDHSSPPVLPPIPFDVPKVPSITAIFENYKDVSAKKQTKLQKSLQENELQLMLIKARNLDIDTLQMPFLKAFKEFELKEARTIAPELVADQRFGYWLFLYVVIQSLPMLIVDAPDLHFTEGVEYFLCEAPQGNPPWMEDVGEVRKMWYQTAGQGIVELSADVIMFSVEGIYMRSHCWLAAKEWEAALRAQKETGEEGKQGEDVLPHTLLPQQETPLEPPRAVFQDMDPVNSQPSSIYGGGESGSLGGTPSGSPQLRPRNGSPASRARHAYRSSIAIGLEPLAFDPSSRPLSESGGGHGDTSSRPGSAADYDSHHHGARSRSIGSLRQFSESGGSGYVQQPAPRQASASSQGGLGPSPQLPPKPHHASTGSVGGGSTFDDILKGISDDKEGGKKKKKNLFF